MNSISEQQVQEQLVSISAGSVSAGSVSAGSVSAGLVQLEGILTIPKGAEGIVLFAHGSGSSRFSPRNRYVAKVLQDETFATLLLDLLTPEEEQIDRQTRQHRFDIALLAERLIAATDWLAQRPDTKHLGIGYFGASTGAGAALVAAAQRPNLVQAIVSRGGRPDLAGTDALHQVRAPTLLIAGGYDFLVIMTNRDAMAQITGEKRLEVVPKATHLFEEPRALEEVAQLASQWFKQYLAASLKMPS
jgi:putative phosphoribosyl transferase